VKPHGRLGSLPNAAASTMLPLHHTRTPVIRANASDSGEIASQAMSGMAAHPAL
jgi:hypothetical protein